MNWMRLYCVRSHCVAGSVTAAAGGPVAGRPTAAGGAASTAAGGGGAAGRRSTRRRRRANPKHLYGAPTLCVCGVFTALAHEKPQFLRVHLLAYY